MGVDTTTTPEIDGDAFRALRDGAAQERGPALASGLLQLALNLDEPQVPEAVHRVQPQSRLT